MEETTIREHKERETRENAEELMRFLDFADIKDFDKVPFGSFQEINFFEDSDDCDHVTEDNESLCCDSSHKD